jgi:hypothetical protein
MTKDQIKMYHELAHLLWQREELNRPIANRVDYMGDRGLAEVLRYQHEAKTILEANDWKMPTFGEIDKNEYPAPNSQFGVGA